MPILIKDIEIPSKCIECKLMHRCGKDDLDYVCMPARVYVEDFTNAYKPRPEFCPLVPVPPHGRLIDADAALRDGWTISRTYSASPTEMVYETKAIDCLPTIISAEEGE